MSPFDKPQLILDSFRQEYQLGLCHLKSAGTPVKSYSLSGELRLTDSGWLVLSVPNALVRGLFDAIGEPGLSLPLNKGRLNAHISVMDPDEVESIGGDSAITERGHRYHYSLGPVKTVTPENWADIGKVHYVTVDAPELRALRKSYGLEPLRKGHDQHITIAIKRKGVTYNNDKSKLDHVKLSADAPGIPSREDFGDLSRLKAGQLIRMVIQAHDARRAKLHDDIRLGDEKGMISFASKKGLPTPGKKHLGIQQPEHSYAYNDFEGEIASGYGAGTVKKKRDEKVLVTHATPDEIHFTTGEGRPERYVMKRTKDKNFIIINTTPTTPVPHEKQRYTVIPPDKAEEVLKNLQPGSSVQSKVDGAASLTKLLKNRAEVLSYRASTKGEPIIHTERIFQNKPVSDIPKEYRNLVLRGELYGVNDETGKPIRPQALGGLLNSGVAKSIEDQRSRGQSLKQLIFDVEGMKDKPYADRVALIHKILPHLPKQLHGPEEVHTPEEAIDLWRKIKAGKGPGGHNEGIVLHPPIGKPSKAKLHEEHNVFLKGFAPGAGKYLGKGIGAFQYSHEPEGPVVGEVGTGISDELRRQMHLNPSEYLGRVARVKAQEKFPSGALRAPALIALDEDKTPLSKSAGGSLAALGAADDIVALILARRNAARRKLQPPVPPVQPEEKPPEAPSKPLLTQIGDGITGAYNKVKGMISPPPAPDPLQKTAADSSARLVGTSNPGADAKLTCPYCLKNLKPNDIYTDKKNWTWCRKCLRSGKGRLKMPDWFRKKADDLYPEMPSSPLAVSGNVAATGGLATSFGSMGAAIGADNLHQALNRRLPGMHSAANSADFMGHIARRLRWVLPKRLMSLAEAPGNAARAGVNKLTSFNKALPKLVKWSPAGVAAGGLMTAGGLIANHYGRKHQHETHSQDVAAWRRRLIDQTKAETLAAVPRSPTSLDQLRQFGHKHFPSLISKAASVDQWRQLASAPPVRTFLQKHHIVNGPGLNLMDTARLQAGRNDHWDAIAQAAEGDRDTYKQLLRGLASRSGMRRGPQFEKAIDAGSQNIKELAPYMMVGAPRLWDQVHGSRGSAASLASALSQAHPERGPVANAGLAQQIHSKMPADSLSSADLGVVYKSMVNNGLLGQKGGIEADEASRRLFNVGGGIRQLIDANREYSMDKSALSVKKVLGTFQRASARGVNPDRLTKYVKAVKRWVPGAERRQVRAFEMHAINNPMSSDWLSKSWGREAGPEISGAINSASKSIGGEPIDRVLACSDFSSSLYKGDSGNQVRLKYPSSHVLMHEVGHAGPGGFPSAHEAGNSSVGRSIWASELMANRNASRMQPILESSLGGAVPSQSNYRRWALNSQLENYRTGMLNGLFHKGFLSLPPMQAGKRNVPFLDRFVKAMPAETRASVNLPGILPEAVKTAAAPLQIGNASSSFREMLKRRLSTHIIPNSLMGLTGWKPPVTPESSGSMSDAPPVLPEAPQKSPTLLALQNPFTAAKTREMLGLKS